MNLTQGAQEYTAAGTYTFTPGSGVYWLDVTAIAAGAGGASTVTGGTDNYGGGAGGAGESCEGMRMACTPGVGITVVVGAGGLHGLRGTGANNATNVHAGPEGNAGAASSGNRNATSTSLDTIVGPLHLRGGYGGIRTGGFPHGGMGGGWAASIGAAVGGPGLADNGEANAPGKFPRKRSGAARYWAGSGGGGGSSTTPGHGGDAGPWSGGAAGANVGATGGGGGGGASLYGPGGAGCSAGTTGGAAPAVPAGSYGAGGGGGGGTTTGGATLDANLGADGLDGYVLLTWIAAT